MQCNNDVDSTSSKKYVPDTSKSQSFSRLFYSIDKKEKIFTIA